MLQCGPLGNEVLISANWYVAAMFMGSILLLCLLMLTGRWGGLFICPVLLLSIYHYYFRLIRKIDVIYPTMQCCVHWQGLVRVFFIGCLIWQLREKKLAKGNLLSGSVRKKNCFKTGLRSGKRYSGSYRGLYEFWQTQCR